MQIEDNVGKISDLRSNFFLALILFLNAFYWIHGFQFGVNNNQEELPLLYALTGIADYPKDTFVQYHIGTYNQITPFLLVMKWLIILLGIQDLHTLFLVFHVLTLSLFFWIMHLFMTKLVNGNALLTSAFGILLFWTSRTFIPAGRWLFTSIFDIELLVIVVICLIIYLHIDRKYFVSSVLLCLVGILYPIYTIPLYPILLLSLYHDFFHQNRKRFFIILAGYTLIPAAYTIILWSISRQTTMLEIDSSAIMEYIRAPWHYKIPSITYMNKKSVGFLLLSLPTFFLSRRFLVDTYWDQSLKYFFNGILIVLLITSIIESFIRIPLIVQISPYRIGVFAVFLAYLILCRILFLIAKANKILSFNLPRKLSIILIIIALVPLGFYAVNTFEKEEFTPAQVEAIQWISKNTGEDALILDYTGLDVRTNCLRSSYWEFKTIPLVADEQVAWYLKYLKFNAYEDVIDPSELAKQFTIDRNVEITTFGILGKDKFNAIELISEPIDLLVTFSDDSLTLKDRNVVFRNADYAILRADE